MNAPPDQLGLLLHDAARLLRKRFEERAAHFGLSSAQWRLLVHVLRPTPAAQGSAGSSGQPLTAGMPGRIERIPGGVAMYFPAGRWWGLKLALAVMGAVFLTVGALVPWERESSGEVGPWLFRLLFG